MFLTILSDSFEMLADKESILLNVSWDLVSQNVNQVSQNKLVCVLKKFKNIFFFDLKYFLLQYLVEQILLLFSHAADWSQCSVGKINNVYNLWSKLYRRAQYYNTSVYPVSILSPYIIQPRCISHFINHYWKGETLSS